jgi:prephenate dehydrogenase
MNRHLFDNITIVGVGLIGGSIGAAVKKRRLARLVTGVVRRKRTVSDAFRMKALDVATFDLKEGVRGADLVILCSPVSVIRAQLGNIAPHLKKGAVVIDVGSSKKEIESAARMSLRKNVFVGCHPMAGSEKTGVEHACPDLFERSVCFVTKAHPAVDRFWKALGASTVLLTAEKHDEWAASASHLPHAISFSLFQNLRTPPAKGIPLNPSLRSLARLAKSHPDLWADIFVSNRRHLSTAVRSVQKNLSLFEKALRRGDSAALRRFIRAANRNSVRLG